ncbi:6-carboxyhexanoate--CoA ligase [Romboutsia sp. 1001713B170207_170306_H8]|uniref:6-carboxyhexanoate--CoA ligase n=1 Tax=Romboutsia sp. 1001713B170207_170306_H8 TaxID=2787112 RepID=UPI00189BF1A2|nr:6-carboxyhexanoate--CoA ligase [Romboutsia sp. 1001713B170207_170306_H8]
MSLYSIKMRSSKNDEHISGAECIVDEYNLEDAVFILLKRARNHSKGKSDFINIKIEEISKSKLEFVNPLEVTTIETNDIFESLECIKYILNKLGIDNDKSIKILKLFREIKNMRGAILLDINTLERLEEDRTRGIRATYMDFEDNSLYHLDKCKAHNSHFTEALALSSKVTNAPNIFGEICYSDDPNYTAGYIACKKYGYIRFDNLKEIGDKRGGRIFLYDPFLDKEYTLNDTINYIENTKVIVKNNINIKQSISYNEISTKL